MIVILAEDTVIDGALRVAGEPVSVADDFPREKIKRVAMTSADVARTAKRNVEKVRQKEKEQKPNPNPKPKPNPKPNPKGDDKAKGKK